MVGKWPRAVSLHLFLVNKKPDLVERSGSCMLYR